MSIEGDRYPSGVFSPGQQLSASSLNDLAGQAAKGQQFFSAGQQVAQGTFGTVNLESQQVQYQSTTDYPFKVSVRSGTGNDKVVTVRPGTVNNFVPKIGGVYLDGPTTPTLTFSSVGSSGKKIVYLKVTKSGATFFPNTCEIVLRDDEVVNNDNEGYFQIASITCSTTGGTLNVTSVNQFVYASQVVARAKPGTAPAIWAFSSR